MGVGEIDFRKNKYKARYKKDGTKIYKIYAKPKYNNTPISTMDIYITKLQDTIILSKNNCYSCKYPIRKKLIVKKNETVVIYCKGFLAYYLDY